MVDPGHFHLSFVCVLSYVHKPQLMFISTKMVNNPIKAILQPYYKEWLRVRAEALQAIVSTLVNHYIQIDVDW